MRTKQVFFDYVDWVSRVGDCTRSEAAAEFGVHRTTATYHLESAVSEGYLERYYAYTKHNQTGWAYRLPGHQQPLPFESDVVSDHAPEWEREGAWDNE